MRAILLCFFLAACGAPSPDAACARWANAWCARLDGCGGSVYGDATICRTREALGCVRELDSPATGDGISRRDRCTAALTTLGCGELDTGACAPAAGQLQNGAQCRFHSQCQSAHCATPRFAPCGMCVPQPAAGDACAVGCNSGLGCDPVTFTCMPGVNPSPQPLPAPLSKEGGPCNRAKGPYCLPPAFCLNDGGSSFAGTCTLPDGAMCANAKVPRNPGPPATFAPAWHDTSFQVPKLDGPVLGAPELVTITWDGYAFRDQVEAFGNFIVGSDWMTAVGEEYGVGRGTHLAVRIPSPAPRTMTDDGVVQQLADWQKDGTLPSPGPNTIYMLYVRDQDTHVTGAYGIESCVQYYGYHYEASGFVYALVASCAPEGLYSEVEQTEITAAHELAEAATDPFPDSNPAYRLTGIFTFAGELADLCDGRNDRVANFAYQRSWSNRAAALGGDPCVPPNPAEPYFRVEISPQVTRMQIGETRELTFTAWSTAPIGELQVVVYYQGGPYAPWILNPYTGSIPTLGYGVAITLPDAPVMTNGVSGHLTFTLPATARPGAEAALSVFARSSTDVYTTWPFVILAEAPIRD